MVRSKRRSKGQFDSSLSKKWIKLFSIIGILGLFVLMLKTQISQFFINNDRFNITDIELLHANQIKLFDVEKLTGLKLGENIFRFDLYQIKEKLEKNIFIRKAHVSRKLPSIIQIEVEERAPLVAIKGLRRWYWMDSDGVVLNPLIELESVESRKVVIDHLQEFINTGYLISPELIAPLIEVIETFHDSILRNQIVLDKIKVNEKGEVYFYREDGLEIIIGKEDVENRLIRLLAILEDLKRRNKKAKRIDLRFSSVPVKADETEEFQNE